MTRKLVALLTALVAVLGAAALPSPAAADVPEGAMWWDATISEEDGTTLHATVFRPDKMPDSTKTPVILSVGPYFNRSGQVGAAGPIQGAPYDPVRGDVPDRFTDFIEGAKLMERGYTVVYVDLRGFGGSTGCLDWAGPGELADVAASIRWAAEQPWSNGKVGMYGKSYDGLTGLMGAALNPDALKAVVSQEPVYDLYRYLYSNGVRYANSAGTPALYDLIAMTPGPLLDDPSYTGSSLDDFQRPGCPVLNYLDQQNSNHADPYWQARDYIEKTKGSDVPVFLTQGFLENNTKPDGAFELFNGLAAKDDNRAWFGMWDHVRGNDKDADGRLLMGREGWFDEVMRFFDHHLKDAPKPTDPKVVVQTSDGTWRAEEQWPPADATSYTSALKVGSYADLSDNSGSGAGSGNGIWTFSPPLAHDAHFAGVPRVKLDVGSPLPRANLAVNVYSVAPDGTALMLTRGTTLVDQTTTLDLELLGNDWKIPAGHRIGVLISSSNSEWFLHTPTLQTVQVKKASISLPFLGRSRTATLAGGPAVRLEEWLDEAPFTVDQATVEAATSPSFALPPAMTADADPTTPPAPTPAPASGDGNVPAAPAATPEPPAPAATAATAPARTVTATTAAPRTATTTSAPSSSRAPAKGATIKARLVRRGGRLVVTGTGPAGRRLTIALHRGARRVLTRRVTVARNGTFSATFAVGRAGAYRASVASVSGAPRLAARTTAVRLRR